MITSAPKSRHSPRGLPRKTLSVREGRVPPMETMNKSSAAVSESFDPTLQFRNLKYIQYFCISKL